MQHIKIAKNVSSQKYSKSSQDMIPRGSSLKSLRTAGTRYKDIHNEHTKHHPNSSTL
jgi:hypothetical protein